MSSSKIEKKKQKKQKEKTTGLKPHPEGLKEKSVKCDFAAHQEYIESALEKQTPVHKESCIIYSCNPNSDGYPRIRFSIPGVYRTWEDGTRMVWTYKQGQAIKERIKLVDFRIYIHKYMYWKTNGNYRQEGLEISHRCHNRGCSVASHMCLEQHIDNLSRIKCPKGIRCNHNPACI